MRQLTLIFLMIGLLCLSFVAHAENGCPPGMIPYSGTDISSCGPVPSGYQSGVPQTPPERWVSQWGAIATDFQAGSIGVSNNMASQQDAKDKARLNCELGGGKNCKIEITYYDQCAALVGGDTGHNSSSAATRNEAIALGVKTCEDAGDKECKSMYSDCSLPKRIQ